MTNWDELRSQRVVYHILGMDRVNVTRNLTYKSVDGIPLTLDVYHPLDDQSASRRPVVIFVHGDAPVMDLKDWGQYVGWGQLAAASGLVGITFNHRSSQKFMKLLEVASDVDDLIRYVRDNHETLKVDRESVCVWTCSAGGPAALRAAIQGGREFVRCIVALYTYLNLEHLRKDIAPAVSDDALREFSPLSYLRSNPQGIAPMFVVRAGLDRPAFNESIDQFVCEASRQNISIEFINYSSGQHGFDTRDDNERSRAIIRRTIDFMKAHLG